MKDYILNLDKDRKLRFGFKSLKLLRDNFGDKSLDQLMNIKMDEIPVLMWAGLRWDDATLNVPKVTDLLDNAIGEKKYTILSVTEIVLEALAAQMGVDTKKVLADTRKKAAETAEKQPIKKEVQKIIPSTKSSKKL